MARHSIFVACFLLLSACASQVPQTAVTVACPPVQDWSPQDLATLQGELAAMPFGSKIWRMELDWQRMRDASRACARP